MVKRDLVAHTDMLTSSPSYTWRNFSPSETFSENFEFRVVVLKFP